MELLVTLIGNAAVDPNFRAEFLENPVAAIQKHGFHMTKGEFEMMQTVFNQDDKKELEGAFKNLETKLYHRLLGTSEKGEARAVPPERRCTQPPCYWSIQLDYKTAQRIQKIA